MGSFSPPIATHLHLDLEEHWGPLVGHRKDQDEVRISDLQEVDRRVCIVKIIPANMHECHSDSSSELGKTTLPDTSNHLLDQTTIQTPQ